jgi:hypothetical protein
MVNIFRYNSVYFAFVKELHTAKHMPRRWIPGERRWYLFDDVMGGG